MQWTFKQSPDISKVEHLSKELNIPEALSKILVQRGVETFEQARRFFRPSLEDLHNPFLMKDMNKAIDRIQKALRARQKILVYGDYDVDGTTAVSLVSVYLKSLNANVQEYIPDRYKEGYGISFQGIDFAHKEKINLIIALDCGIRAVEKVAYANKKNVDFIICDHHCPSDKIPDAVAVLNPKRKDCNYPYKELCGCGVGFKLVQALQEKLKQPFEQIKSFLDLVAIAIAADIVPINGENRILAFHGLKIINENPRTGIEVLKQGLGEDKKITISDIVFGIAPKINAAARIRHGLEATKILLENDKEKAKKLAKRIENDNKERKKLERKITKEALEQIENNKELNHCSTVVYNENWHKGVIGIVASRLIETHYRPTIVFTKNEDFLVGSARSVNNFDLCGALEKCSDCIEQFGGHKYAAGLSVKSEPHHYQKFKQKFENIVTETLPNKLKTPEIVIDTQIHLEEIIPKFYRILRQMAPFGPESKRPVFFCKNLKDTGFAKRVGEQDKHLKLQITQEDKPQKINAIGFGLGYKKDLVESDKTFEAVFCISENVWKGNISLQLEIKDLR